MLVPSEISKTCLLLLRFVTQTVMIYSKLSDYISLVAESPKGKEKSGGMAYEVILKPAAGDSPAPRPKSPPKERPLSQELIDKKLKEAEERRQVCRKISQSKKVLLRERKRHTDRSVSSTPYAVLSRERGYLPWLRGGWG